MAWGIAYVTSLVVMGLLDFAWLTNSKPMYAKALAPAMAENPNMTAAVVFYLTYLVGIMIFAVRPALASGDWKTATLFGALFGFFAYATYDLTNLATLKNFSLTVTLADLAWGTFITASAASAGAFAALKFAR